MHLNNLPNEVYLPIIDMMPPDDVLRLSAQKPPLRYFVKYYTPRVDKGGWAVTQDVIEIFRSKIHYFTAKLD